MAVDRYVEAPEVDQIVGLSPQVHVERSVRAVERLLQKKRRLQNGRLVRRVWTEQQGDGSELAPRLPWLRVARLDIRVAAEVLEKLEAIVRLASTEQRVAKTGQAVLRMAAAMGTSNIAMLVGVNERTVRKCKKRFDGESPIDKLADDPRSERPPSVCRVPMQRS